MILNRIGSTISKSLLRISYNQPSFTFVLSYVQFSLLGWSNTQLSKNYDDSLSLKFVLTLICDIVMNVDGMI